MADQGNEGLLSPFLREQRLKAVKNHLNNYILDIGCGSGELARLVRPDLYTGYDIDHESLKIASMKFPNHTFLNEHPSPDKKFDTLVSMAVIEHAKDPVDFLVFWSGYLTNHQSKFVITTPHPRIKSIHELGAKFRIFSSHGADEHEELLDFNKIQSMCTKAKLNIIHFKKFLFGMNQIFILTKI